MEKFIKDGKMAVLISPGFGAGWSTWGEKELAYDKRVVDFWLGHNHNKEYINELERHESKTNKTAKKLFKSWGYDDVYFGGFQDIVLKWIPLGTKFVIREYDGSESIQTVDDIDWIIA